MPPVDTGEQQIVITTNDFSFVDVVVLVMITLFNSQLNLQHLFILPPDLRDIGRLLKRTEKEESSSTQVFSTSERNVLISSHLSTQPNFYFSFRYVTTSHNNNTDGDDDGHDLLRRA